jgi:hypothetical protein
VVGDGAARVRVEALLDLRHPVLADVARLGGEDDERVALRGHDDVGVAVDDLEPREVRDRSLEPRVLASRDDEAVERVLGHRGADVGEPPVELIGNGVGDGLKPVTDAAF